MLVVALIVCELCIWSLFFEELRGVLSGFAIILLGMRAGCFALTEFCFALFLFCLFLLIYRCPCSVFLNRCPCSVCLNHGVMGWSQACDYGTYGQNSL